MTKVCFELSADAEKNLKDAIEELIDFLRARGIRVTEEEAKEAMLAALVHELEGEDFDTVIKVDAPLYAVCYLVRKYPERFTETDRFLLRFVCRR